MGIVAKTSRGWKTLKDVISEAKKGKVFKFAGMSPKHADINYLLEQKYGVKFNTVILRGGKKVMNAITAGDDFFGRQNPIAIQIQRPKKWNQRLIIIVRHVRQN